MLCTSTSTADLSAGAIDPADSITFTPAQWSSMIGSTINGYYLSTDNTFKPIQLTYDTYTYVGRTDIDGVAEQDFAGACVCWYRTYYPADWAGNETYYPLWTIDLNLHFGNVTYFRGFFGNVLSDFLSQRYNVVPVSTLRQYYDITMGQNMSDVVQLSARRTDSSLGSLVYMQNGYVLSALYYEEEYSNPTDLYIGTANLACVDAAGGMCYIGFVCPTINSGYVYYGHSEPPAPPSSDIPGSMSGSGSGLITTDASGVTGFAWDVTLDMPEYMYSGSFAEYSDSMPSALSSMQSGMDSFGTTAVSALAAVADDTDIGGIWDIISEFLPPGIVTLIIGVSGIYIVGWILTRYAG